MQADAIRKEIKVRMITTVGRNATRTGLAGSTFHRFLRKTQNEQSATIAARTKPPSMSPG